MSVEQVVLSIIFPRVGEQNSIGMDELLRCVRLEHPEISSLGQLRGIIHDLRQHGHLIASGSDGYFYPQGLAEAFRYVEQQFRQPSRDQLLTARIQRDAARRQFGQQMEMF